MSDTALLDAYAAAYARQLRHWSDQQLDDERTWLRSVRPLRQPAETCREPDALEVKLGLVEDEIEAREHAPATS
jgi:hypothetical protein